MCNVGRVTSPSHTCKGIVKHPQRRQDSCKKKKKREPRKYGSSEGGIKPEQFYNLLIPIQPYTNSLNLFLQLLQPFFKNINYPNKKKEKQYNN